MKSLPSLLPITAHITCMHTIVGVLSRDLGDSIPNLLPHIGERLASQAIHQVLPDNQSLLSGEGREEFFDFVRNGVFSRSRRYPSENYCGERARLSTNITVRRSHIKHRQGENRRETRQGFLFPLFVFESRTYPSVLRTMYLLHQPHQKNIRTVLDPIIVQLLFSLRPNSIVGSGKTA